MSELHTPAVAALIEACIKGLAMSEFAYRDDWPDIGKTSRELLHKRVMAVLDATGIPLDVLAEIAGAASADKVAMAAKITAMLPSIKLRRWDWWK